MSKEVIFCFRKYYIEKPCRIIWNGQRLKSERVIADPGDKSNIKAWNRTFTVAGRGGAGVEIRVLRHQALCSGSL